MKWTTKNGFEIYRVLSGRSNSYLIKKDKIAILIDTGKKLRFNDLSKNLDLLNVKFNEILFLILTHTHFDHCQSANKIKEKSKCKIIISITAIDSVQNGYTKLPGGSFLITKLISRIGQLFGKSKFGYESFNADILIRDDYYNAIDDSRIRIIETPGHSIDSISIIVDNEIAIVGDVMFGIFKNSVFPPYADDIPTVIESWGKLLKTDCNIFLPGHGRGINRDLFEKEYEKYYQKQESLHSIH